MSILSKASLVQIPSGYGEDKLYSEVPNTAAGDFTFTRSSTGTRVNADGYIEEVPCNKLGYSEDFSSWATWQQGAALTPTLTTDAVNSPIGTLTADRLQCNQVATGSPNRVGKSFVFSSTQASFGLSQRITLSCWVKSASGSDEDFSLVIRNATLIDATYNLIATNEWQRFELEYETLSFDLSIQVIIGLFQHPTTTTNDIYIWGAQLVKGTSPKTYIKTTDRLDIPRLDYSGGATCPTLLLEPQSTNLVKQSEDMSSSIYVKSNVTFTGQTTTAPDGNQAEFLTVDGYIFLNMSAIGGTAPTTTRTFSFYVKAQSAGYEILYRKPDGTTILTNVSNTEWTRIEATSLSTSNNIMLTDNRAIQSVGNVAFWGVQMEDQSYATSYIPTSGTSVTRVADVCDDAGDATIFNDLEGVLFVEIAALADDLTSRVISLNDGSTSNRVIILYQTITSAIRVIVSSGGSIEFDSSTQNYDITNFNKIALKYKENDFALWINGTEVSTNTSGLTPIGLNNLEFNNANGTSNFYGKCKQLIYFNEALTDTELITLTT